MQLVAAENAQWEGEEFRDEKGVDDPQLSTLEKGESRQLLGPKFDCEREMSHVRGEAECGNKV